METNPVIQTILSRRSVRHFTGKPVAKPLLEVLIKAGMAAPSARNIQPWLFIGITNRDKLNQLADGLPYAKMLYNAPSAIVVCGDTDRTPADNPEGYWVQDCAAATQNILLAAEALGLGAVWTGVFPRPERVKVVKDVLGLPAGIIPLNVIPIGHPEGIDRPKDKFRQENTRWVE